MLIQLQVNDFTLVQQLQVDFGPGLTVLTGETGAGKSILLGALQLALGERADADKVRTGAERAEVCACFDVQTLPSVQTWLNESDLNQEQDCILRRIVTSEGRSKAFINGTAVTLAQLRSLGNLLLDIHSQHEHQALLHAHTHRLWLDEFGQHLAELEQVKNTFLHWQTCVHQANALRSQASDMNARYQLLRYQVDELDQLAIGTHEVEALEQKQKRVANAQLIVNTYTHLDDVCCGAEDAIQVRMYKAIQMMQSLPVQSPRLLDAQSMFQSALIQIEEANRELQLDLESYQDQDDDLMAIEHRLSDLYDMARKHRVAPEHLADFQQTLTAELGQLSSGDAQLEVLDQVTAEALTAYQQAAIELTEARRKAAKTLSQAVNQELAYLALDHGQFTVALNEVSAPNRWGQESIEFLISTVPGRPPAPLAKMASGGELSRISLAIQVVIAKTSVIPTLVFDEVDAGIGGVTGDVVGRMLRQLGQSTQVLCVTHLAQVASKAHHHLKVEKTVSKKHAATQIVALTGDDKISEIARMMGGTPDSAQSLAHAKVMLES